MAEKVAYNLQINKDLYDSLKNLADADGVTIAELLRRGIKWEMLFRSLEKDGNTEFFIEQNGQKHKIIPL